MSIDAAIATYHEFAKPEYGVLASHFGTSRSLQYRINRDYQRSLTFFGRMVNGVKRFAAGMVGLQVPTIADLMDQQVGIMEHAAESLGKIVGYSQQFLDEAEAYRTDLQHDLCDAAKKRKELEARQEKQKQRLKTLDEECTTLDPATGKYRTASMERLRLRRSVMQGGHDYAMLSRRVVNYHNEQPILDHLEDVMRRTSQSCEVMQETTQHHVGYIKRIRTYAAAASSQSRIAQLGRYYCDIFGDLQKPAEKEIIDNLTESTGRDTMFDTPAAKDTSTTAFRIQLDAINSHVNEWYGLLTGNIIDRADCCLNPFQDKTPFPHSEQHPAQDRV